MSETLSFVDTIQRIGNTTINDVRVVRYTCTITVDRPQDMQIGISKLNTEMYKAHRDLCRADYGAFEDAAYQLQEELLAKIGA